ncbi:hypothetical protein, partial [Haemophilus parainfluenzae]|uniref:hypothetical protein n=1 Tax=Haemophilus parainfluenzae TaxID=729 RepID=UPI001CEDAEC7
EQKINVISNKGFCQLEMIDPAWYHSAILAWCCGKRASDNDKTRKSVDSKPSVRLQTTEEIHLDNKILVFLAPVNH